MGREMRAWMARNQSKAGMGIAYGQRNESVDAEKSVQSWHRTAYRQRKVSEMPRNQSKAGMGIAYRQRNESMDVEKSVQS